MTIYDFGNQEIFNLNSLYGFILILLFGLYAFLITLHKPKDNFFNRAFSSNIEPILQKAVGKIFIVFMVVLLIINLSLKLKDLYYVKNIDKFETIETVTGRITFIDYSEQFGLNYINITIARKNFNIVKDSRYISTRNLTKGDSIKVDYFYDELRFAEVAKIELIKGYNKS